MKLSNFNKLFSKHQLLEELAEKNKQLSDCEKALADKHIEFMRKWEQWQDRLESSLKQRDALTSALESATRGKIIDDLKCEVDTLETKIARLTPEVFDQEAETPEVIRTDDQIENDPLSQYIKDHPNAGAEDVCKWVFDRKAREERDHLGRRVVSLEKIIKTLQSTVEQAEKERDKARAARDRLECCIANQGAAIDFFRDSLRRAEKKRDEAIERAERAEARLEVWGLEWDGPMVKGDKPITCGTSKESVDAISRDIQRADTMLCVGGPLNGHCAPRGTTHLKYGSDPTVHYERKVVSSWDYSGDVLLYEGTSIDKMWEQLEAWGIYER